MHPALTDAVTHLGAFKDTDRSPDGTAASARVPVALSLYKPTMLKKHVRRSDPIADLYRSSALTLLSAHDCLPAVLLQNLLYKFYLFQD